MNHYKILFEISVFCNFICNIRLSICQGFALGKRRAWMKTFIQSIYIHPGGAIFLYSDWLSHPPRELATAKAMASGRSDFLSNILILSESAWRRFNNERIQHLALPEPNFDIGRNLESCVAHQKNGDAHIRICGVGRGF